MSNLGNKEIMAVNIKRLMDERGKDRNDICRDLGFKYTTFTDWINAKTYPRIDKIEMMANYFGVSKADLVEEMNVKASAITTLYNVHCETEKEADLVLSYRELSDFGKEKVSSYTNNLLEIERADLALNAAHARTDIDIPEGTDTSDDDIMDDENF